MQRLPRLSKRRGDLEANGQPPCNPAGNLTNCPNLHNRNFLPKVHKTYTGQSLCFGGDERGTPHLRRIPSYRRRPLMLARSAYSVLFEENSVGKRLAAGPCACVRALSACLFAASICLFLSACGNDDSKPAATPATTAEQINAAPPAPWAVPPTTGAKATQSALPAHTIQTPPPPTQVGTAASDSLATPVIHTVD
jgi:hypothetical protein